MFSNGFEQPGEGYHAAEAYGKQLHSRTFMLYDKSLPEEQYIYYSSVNPDDAITLSQETEKLNVISAAYAQTSSGTAYVVVPDGR